MEISNVSVKEFNNAIGLGKALLAFPGADTVLRFSGANDKLQLCANTIGIRIQVSLDATVVKEGSCFLNLTSLTNLKFTGDTLTIKSTDASVALTCKKSKFELNQESVPNQEDFSVEQGNLLIIFGILKQLINTTVLEKEDSKDIFIRIGKGKLYVETSEPNLGAFSETSVSGWENQPELDIVINRKNLAAILTALGACCNRQESISLNVTPTTIAFNNGPYYIALPTLTSKEDKILLKTNIEALLGREKKCFTFDVDVTELDALSTNVLSLVDSSKSNIATALFKVSKTFVIVETVGSIGTFKTKFNLTNLRGEVITTWTVQSKALSQVLSLIKGVGTLKFTVVGSKALLLEFTTAVGISNYILSQVQK